VVEPLKSAIRNPQSAMPAAGIILCGGRSTRMGRPKALLPFGQELMLPRVVRILGEVVEPIVVVAAPGQELPPLPGDVLVARDRREGRGPLEGLAAGLAALSRCREPSGTLRARADVAYVSGCDVPLLMAAFVRRVLELLGDHDIAVPKVDGYHHPLAAAYRTSVLPHVEALLAADRLRPAFLFERVRTREIAREELIDVDPELTSLINLNRPEDYQAALARAGLGQGG
jgi:molybdopterin-guanine dinucleotide biosynthesis protein A